MNDLDEMKFCRDELIARKTELRRELAESKREWFTKRGGLTPSERFEREAEICRVEEQLQGLYHDIHVAEKAVKLIKRAVNDGDFLRANLIRVMEREGLQYLVREAERMTDAELVREARAA